MLLKAGVDISRLNREIRRALAKVNKVYLRHNEELVVTSTYEGAHSAGSLHYANDAIDIRYPSKDRAQIIAELKNILGDDFDVVTETDHIHIEYDPPRYKL